MSTARPRQESRDRYQRSATDADTKAGGQSTGLRVDLPQVVLSVQHASSIKSVNAAAWDALDHGPSPFLESGFLRALEESRSIGARSGWDPHYLQVLEDETLIGGVVAFVKSHSYGEYIFDWGWAQGSHRAGIPYYPKLVIAAPVTPATGKRMLLHPDLDDEKRAGVRAALAAMVKELADEYRCSSIHWLFCTAEEQKFLVDNEDYAARDTYQFHWHNRGYEDYDEFLGQLASRKRKQLKKERRRALEAIDSINFVAGTDMSDAQVDSLDRFYRRTCFVRGGKEYLRPGFFHALCEHLPHRVQFVDVHKDEQSVAGALYFETEQALYGRYWGCDDDIEFLHFEVAYYSGIERCIERKIGLFEAGAQGEHKLLRGFLPNATYSAHWVRHPALDRAIREHLRAERRGVKEHMRQLESYGPYKREDC